MKEDVGQEWRPVGRGDEAQLPEEARGNQRKVEQEPVEYARRQADLIEERKGAGIPMTDQTDDRRVSACDGVSPRNMRRLLAPCGRPSSRFLP